MIRALLLALAIGSAQAACPPTPTLPTAPQAQAWAEQAGDRGLLWRLSRGGQASYLFGTLHLGKPDWAYPGPALRAAWARTDVLAVELDPADVGPALAAAPPAAPLPPAQARRVDALARAACLPAGALSTLPALLQLTTLTLLEARRDGFDAAFGQDLMLLARARAEGRPVLSLETVAEQLAALDPGADAPALIDAGLKQLQAGQARAPLRRLAGAWARGDLALLADYPRWCACASTPAERAWLSRINDDRNRHLAERIDTLHATGQRLLVAVGALHMTGPEALPALLAARGFTVEPLLPRK